MGYNDATAIAVRDMIRRERDHRGWTQTQLAQQMTNRGIPTNWPAIHKIENGQRNVTISEAAAIADAFGVTITRLTGGRQRPKADYDFALRRLHESIADAQRTLRTTTRDITNTLTATTELTPNTTLNTVITETQTCINQLDTTATNLATIGGKIAQARGQRTINHTEPHVTQHHYTQTHG